MKIKYEEKEEKMKYEDNSDGDEPLSLIQKNKGKVKSVKLSAILLKLCFSTVF